ESPTESSYGFPAPAASRPTGRAGSRRNTPLRHRGASRPNRLRKDGARRPGPHVERARGLPVRRRRHPGLSASTHGGPAVLRRPVPLNEEGTARHSDCPRLVLNAQEPHPGKFKAIVITTVPSIRVCSDRMVGGGSFGVVLTADYLLCGPSES